MRVDKQFVAAHREYAWGEIRKRTFLPRQYELRTLLSPVKISWL